MQIEPAKEPKTCKTGSKLKKNERRGLSTVPFATEQFLQNHGTLVVPEVRPQQHDVRDAFDGEGGELVGEDGRESPAMFALVRSEAAWHRGNLAEVCSVGVRSRRCGDLVPSTMITMRVSQFAFRRHRGTVAEEHRVETAAARTPIQCHGMLQRGSLSSPEICVGTSAEQQTCTFRVPFVLGKALRTHRLAQRGPALSPHDIVQVCSAPGVKEQF